MTVKQFRKKVDIARRYGKTYLDNGSVLHYCGPGGSIVWYINDKYGNTVDTASNPKQLEYLYAKRPLAIMQNSIALQTNPAQGGK